MKIDQRQIREYLLGRQPSSVEEFEEQLFTDEDLYLAVQEEQDTLIEDFVKGELSKDDAQRFQQQCNLSSTLAHKVSEFRALIGALEQHQPQMRTSQLPVRHDGWQIGRFVPLFAGIACTLLISVTFILHRRSLDASQTGPALSIEQHATQSKGAPAGPEATFFLADGVTRGDSNKPHLKITPETSAINLQLELRSSSASISSWSVEVLHGREQVWSSSAVQPQHVEREIFLAAHVAVGSMPDGLYTVRLRPLGSKQAPLSREFVLERSK
jgi:hypothetical protein